MAEPLFHRAHYNILAGQFRSAITDALNIGSNTLTLPMGKALYDLALNVAKRLKEDDPNFDAATWLDQCSPNSKALPLSELWDDYIG